MRFLFTFFLAFLCFNLSFAQFCLQDGISFYSQAEIDNFAADYPGCTEILGDVYIIGDSVSITSLDGLSQVTSIGGFLQIELTDLTDLSGLENLNSIGGFLVRENPLLLNLNELSGVNSIIYALGILNNASLNSIAGLSNTEILSDSYSTVIVLITGNPNLSFCSMPNLCNYLLNPLGIINDIADNGSGCNSIDEILFNCSQLARIKNLSFYDINQNKIQDAGEPYYSDISVALNPGDTDMLGSPSVQYVLPGGYTVTYDEAANENWSLTTDSMSYFLSAGAGEEATFAFGVYPSQLVSQLTSFISSPNARCNEDVIFDISTRNTGTTIASGTMWLQVDENVMQTNFITPPDTITTTSPPYYGWYFTDLFPGETFTVEAEFGIPGPPDFPVGNFLNFVSFADYDDANGANTSEAFRYDAEVRCSFDPNDKLFNPTRFHNEVLFDEDLIYTIRFQNTGNDVAYDVRILDTLDTNLDWSTFRVLGSSHSEVLNTSLNDEGVITFDFTEIFLPDSTADFEGSNGYVTYMINALDGIDENTVIRNSAGIYFDQNPPVLTNTTESVMVSMLTMPVECNDDELTVEVIITTDNYGNETLWEVIDTNTNEAYYHVNWGTYPNFLDSTYIHEFCIPQNSCVDFTIRDSYGDGICCDLGEGSYQVILEGDTIATGGNFGSSESVIFHCDSTTVSVIPTSSFPDLTIQPNPNTGTFQVEGIPRGTYHLLNTAGQIIQSGQVENGTLIDISAAAQGVYFIQMMVDEYVVTRRVVKL